MKKTAKIKKRFFIKYFLYLLIGSLLTLLSVRAVLFGFSYVKAQSNSNLTHGPIVGAVSDSKATVWMRVVDEFNRHKLTAIASTDRSILSGNPQGLRSVNFVSAGAKNTFKAELTGLSPNTVYYYDVLDGGVTLLGSSHRFKTFAAKGVNAGFSFGLLSDFGTNNSDGINNLRTNTFSYLAAENPRPDFVYFGGDFWHTNIYKPGMDVNTFKRTTQTRFQEMYSLNSPLGYFDDFVGKILSDFPLVHHFDDHDMGDNNVNKTFPFKTTSLEVLNEYFPTYPTSSYGDWQKFSYGNSDFFVLDVRSQRDPNGTIDSINKSMLDGDNLGQEGQLTWFKAGLLNSKATWKFVFMGVPFNRTLVKGDSWVGFKTERKALVDFIKANLIKGVVFISGDVHFGALDNGKYSSFPEITIPSPNIVTRCGSTSDFGSWSNGVYGTPGDSLPCNGYAKISVFTNPDRITAEIKDDNGNVRLNMDYSLIQSAQNLTTNSPD